MDSNIKLAKEHGLVGKLLVYIGLNTYYPESVTEFVKDKNEVQFTKRIPPFGWYSNGIALTSLESGFYTPQDNGVAILSDLTSELEISVVDFRYELPKNRTHITNILLELKEGKDMPRLVKYGPRR